MTKGSQTASSSAHSAIRVAERRLGPLEVELQTHHAAVEHERLVARRPRSTAPAPSPSADRTCRRATGRPSPARPTPRRAAPRRPHVCARPGTSRSRAARLRRTVPPSTSATICAPRQTPSTGRPAAIDGGDEVLLGAKPRGGGLVVGGHRTAHDHEQVDVLGRRVLLEQGERGRQRRARARPPTRAMAAGPSKGTCWMTWMRMRAPRRSRNGLSTDSTRAPRRLAPRDTRHRDSWRIG